MVPEIKIGDKIKLIKPSYETKRDHPLLLVGDEGIVVHTINQFDFIKHLKWKAYCVNWGKPINGSNLEGRCQDGHGSCVERDEIEAI
jgi:hypothetical protein